MSSAEGWSVWAAATPDSVDEPVGLLFGIAAGLVVLGAIVVALAVVLARAARRSRTTTTEVP